MDKQQSGAPDAPPGAKDPAEFKNRLRRLQGEVDQLESNLAALVNSTRLGKTLRRQACELRPTLAKSQLEAPVETVIQTLEAEALLDQLVGDPRFGRNTQTYLWAKIGRHPNSLHLLYPALIEIARTKEKERGVPASVKQRIRTIRLVIEREYELEKYVEWREIEIRKRRLLATQGQNKPQAKRRVP